MTRALLLALFAACAHAPPDPPGRRNPAYANEMVAAEYGVAVRLKVECVYPEYRPKNAIDDYMAKFFPSFGPSKSVGGSGVAVGPGDVLTARHVVDCNWTSPSGAQLLDGEAWQIKATRRDGSSFEMVVEKWGDGPAEEFPRHDAALLSTTNGAQPFKHWAPLADRVPLIGSEVCVMAARPFWSRTCGHVQDYLKDGDVFDDEPGHTEWAGDGYFTYDLFSTGGTSGSGIYNERGELVGLNVGETRHLKIGYLAVEFRSLVPQTWPDLDIPGPWPPWDHFPRDGHWNQ